MSTATIGRLPEEIIVRIAGFNDPVSLLDFARASRQTLRCSQRFLEQHQKWHPENRLIHDRKQLTVPRLVREALEGDPRILFHLRRAEFWTSRFEWSEWKPEILQGFDDEAETVLEYADPSHDEDECYSDLDRSFYDSWENNAAELETIMRDALGFPGKESSLWMSRIRRGYDDPLKGILMALAPRLQDAIFIAHATSGPVNSPDRDEDENEEVEYHPLIFIINAISHIVASPNQAWPPGFQSLRKVSVCSFNDMRHPHDGFYLPASHISILFKLPNIETLVFNVAGFVDEDPGIDLPPRSSTVQHLSFSCCDLEATELRIMIASAQCLQSLVFDSESSLGDGALTWMVDHCVHESLEVLHPGVKLKSDIKLSGPDILKRFTSLKHYGNVSLDENVHILANRRHLLEVDPDLQPLPELRQILPPSIETFGLEALQRNLWRDKWCSSLLQNILRLVEDPRFQKLRLICMSDIALSTVGGDDDISRERFVWHEKICHRIKAMGVTIHRNPVRGTGNEAFHSREEEAHRLDIPNTLRDRHQSDPRYLLPRFANKWLPKEH